MDKFVIEGISQPLSGSLTVSGSKNAALPSLFATILTDQPCTLENVPDICDIDTTIQILENLGVRISLDRSKQSVNLQAHTIRHFAAPYDLVRTMRASVLVLGPLLARFRKARVSLPGGCSIGARPVNLHLAALERMGAKIELQDGYIEASAASGLRGAEILFDKVSVGATENILMAASLAKGKTHISNAAREPEIVDLVQYLRKMGAKISGEGSSEIEVEGVSTLHGAVHRVVADRIEAGTYLVAAAITGGDLLLNGIRFELMGAVLKKLTECGMRITETQSGIRIQSNGVPQAIDISTAPFPGFPTDMQAQFMSLMTVAQGTSVISENIFENRFMHVAELMRLGADISIKGHTAIVRGHGPGSLNGATVMATDLRASACLVLAGLAARGTTTIRRVYHLDRGYQNLEVNLRKLGAKIARQVEKGRPLLSPTELDEK